MLADCQFNDKDNKIEFTKEEVNKKNKNGHTSLIVAIDAGKPKIAECLIRDFGADVNVKFGKDGDTPLHLAF